MRIICWNVNGIRANIKKGGFDWFLQQSPDFFCIQETKAHPDQLEPSTVSPDGYVSFFDHSKLKKGYSGVAVYTKNKPDKVDYGFGLPEYDQEGRFLALFYDNCDKNPIFAGINTPSKLKKFVLINCYFPNGGGGPERLDFKLRFYDQFLKYIDARKKDGYEVIFCGDVNTAHHEIDLARPKENEKNTGFLPVEREWIDQVIAHSYTDVFRNKYPDKIGAYTYWDMKTFARERNVGWRIDYFFVTKALLQAVKKTSIHSGVLGSDHCPIEISF